MRQCRSDNLETQGYSHEILEDYIKNIKKVTSKDIQECSKKYFTDDTLTVVTIDPQPIDTKQTKKREATCALKE